MKYHKKLFDKSYIPIRRTIKNTNNYIFNELIFFDGSEKDADRKYCEIHSFPKEMLCGDIPEENMKQYVEMLMKLLLVRMFLIVK